jgi:hypothetical protein
MVVVIRLVVVGVDTIIAQKSASWSVKMGEP